MAVFRASTAFSFNTLDLTALLPSNTKFSFFDNLNLLTGARAEEDLAVFQSADGMGIGLVLGGKGFAFAPDLTPAGGIIKAITDIGGGNLGITDPAFSLRGIAIPLIDFLAAVGTADKIDDIDLLAYTLSGNDKFYLSAGNDMILGFGGDDMIVGYAGNDILQGGTGNDRVYGGLGSDTLFGGSGNDLLSGGTGIDRVNYSNIDAGVTIDLRVTGPQNTGGQGTDTLISIEAVTGSTQNDLIHGNAKANWLEGLDGDDTINGHEGNDQLTGGAGRDTLIGGTGSDQFVLNPSTNLVPQGGTHVFDTITDFAPAEHDQIVLSKALFAELTSIASSVMSDAEFYAADGATNGHDSTDRVVYNTATGALYFDPDGDGSIAGIQIAQLGTDTHPALSFSDILIIA